MYMVIPVVPEINAWQTSQKTAQYKLHLKFFWHHECSCRHTHLELLVDKFRHLLVVGLEQLNGLVERLKHAICGGLSVPHGQQMMHHSYQSIIVTLRDIYRETTTCDLDEL